jgi:hypothetical protein
MFTNSFEEDEVVKTKVDAGKIPAGSKVTIIVLQKGNQLVLIESEDNVIEDIHITDIEKL